MTSIILYSTGHTRNNPFRLLMYAVLLFCCDHGLLEPFLQFGATVCPDIAHDILCFIADFGATAGIVAMDKGGDFAQGEGMGCLLFYYIQVPATDLDDRFFHSALFQLADDFLFKFAGYLSCPGALFE